MENKNKSMGIILGIVAIIVLIAGAWLFFYRDQQNNDQINQEPTPAREEQSPDLQTSPTSEVSPTEATEVPDNWSTYRSEELNFSISHPQEAVVEEFANAVKISIWGPTQDENTEFSDGIFYRFSNWETKENQTTQNYAHQKRQEEVDSSFNDQVSEITTANIDNLEGYQFEAKGRFETTFYYFPINDYEVLQISEQIYDPQNQNFAKVAQQMRESLEIIN